MIGVVGPGGAVERLVEAIEGGPATAGSAEAVLAESPAVVAAVGEAAVSAVVRAGAGVPVLPVDQEAGLASVPLDRAPGVLERGLAEGFATRERPVVEAAIGGEPLGRGVFDVALVTGEPAEISEFAVETPGGTDRFRADGVAVATPAGSAGYTRALGGPVLDPDASCLVVVPIAAFTVRPTVRVASAEATLDLRVTRDDGDIALLVDGVDHGLIPPRRPLAVRVADALEVVVVEADAPARLEKL